MRKSVEVRHLMVDYLKNKARSMSEEEILRSTRTASVDDILELLAEGEGEFTAAELTLLLSSEPDIKHKTIHTLKHKQTSQGLLRRKHPHLRGWPKNHPNYRPDWKPTCHCHKDVDID